MKTVGEHSMKVWLSPEYKRRMLILKKPVQRIEGQEFTFDTVLSLLRDGPAFAPVVISRHTRDIPPGSTLGDILICHPTEW